MDEKTIDAYNAHAGEFCERYRKGQRVSVDKMVEVFGKRNSILEIGIGSGIDAAGLLNAGYEVTGVEPSQALIDQSVAHFPELKGRIIHGALPFEKDALKEIQGKFEGILCNAVLMHLEKSLRAKCLSQFSTVLAEGGRGLITVSPDRVGLDAQQRDEFGRLYQPFVAGEMESYLEACKLQLLHFEESPDKWSRSGMVWWTFVAEKKQL